MKETMAGTFLRDLENFLTTPLVVGVLMLERKTARWKDVPIKPVCMPLQMKTESSKIGDYRIAKTVPLT